IAPTGATSGSAWPRSTRAWTTPTTWCARSHRATPRAGSSSQPSAGDRAQPPGRSPAPFAGPLEFQPAHAARAHAKGGDALPPVALEAHGTHAATPEEICGHRLQRILGAAPRHRHQRVAANDEIVRGIDLLREV